MTVWLLSHVENNKRGASLMDAAAVPTAVFGIIETFAEDFF